MNQRKRLGDILLETKLITTAQLEEALKRQKELSLPLGETLVHLKFVSEKMLMDTLSRYFDVEFINISENNYQIIDKSLVRVLSLEVCRRLKVLPLFQVVDEDFKELTIAMADPLADYAVREVEELTGCKVTPVLATTHAIKGGICKMFDIQEEVSGDTPGDRKESDAVALVNKMLVDAVTYNASDIHIEPHATEIHVRMRIDGVLQLISTIRSSYLPSIIARIKVMGSETGAIMRIDEKRLPQDGTFSRLIGGHTIDCRVSTLPTLYGEKVVIRIFDKDKSTHVERIAHIQGNPDALAGIVKDLFGLKLEDIASKFQK